MIRVLNVVSELFAYLFSNGSAEGPSLQATFGFGEFWWERREAAQQRLAQNLRKVGSWNWCLTEDAHCVGMFCLLINFPGFPLLEFLPLSVVIAQLLTKAVTTHTHTFASPTRELMK